MCEHRTSHSRRCRQAAVSLAALPPRLTDPSRPIRTLTGVVCLAVASCLTGCAGYQLGNQSLYPGGIRTVYVPVFESSSFRRNLGERLTEAVQKEIELKTPYKVTGSPSADSELRVRIANEGKHVVVESRTGEPREVQVDMQVEVSWTDRRGNPVRPTRQIPVSAELTEVGGSANLVPEAGQSIATAQQQAIGRLAEQIVALMEAPW